MCEGDHRICAVDSDLKGLPSSHLQLKGPGPRVAGGLVRRVSFNGRPSQLASGLPEIHEPIIRPAGLPAWRQDNGNRIVAQEADGDVRFRLHGMTIHLRRSIAPLPHRPHCRGC